jgi:hypothetical protein
MYMVQRRNLSIGITINLENYENLRLEVSGEVCGEGDEEELIVYLDSILSRLGRGTPETAERVDSYRKRVFSLPEGPGTPSAEQEARTESSPLPGQLGTEPTPSPIGAPTPPAEVPIARSASSPAMEKRKDIQVNPVSPVMGMNLPSTGKKETATPAGRKETSLPPASQTGKKAVSAPPVPPETAEPSLSLQKESAASVAPVKKDILPPPASPATTAAPTSAGAKVPVPEEFSCERCGEPITPVQRKLSRMFQNKDLCKKCLQQL